MPIQVSCRNGHRLKIAEKHAGMKVACPVCKQPVKVPAVVEALAEPAAPPVASAAPPQVTPEIEPTLSAPPLTTTPTTTPAPLAAPVSPTPSSQANGWIRRQLGYRPDRGRLETVYFLAGGYAAFSLFTLAPALFHLNLTEAPGWAKLVLLVSLLQLAYAAWIALAPDWSSLWVAMLSLGVVAVLYAMGMAITLTAKPGAEQLLGLSELLRTQGRKPVMWCVVVVLLASLLAYLTGLTSYRWHKAYRLVYPLPREVGANV